MTELTTPSFSYGDTMLQMMLPMELPLQKNSLVSRVAKRPSKIEIRELQSSEQDFHMLELAQEMVAESELNESIDVDEVLLSCIQIRADIERKGVNVFIAYDEGKPIGYILGVTSKAFHRKGIVAEMKLMYIKPVKRGSLTALLLLKAYERWAILNGATQIFTGTVNKQHAERTSKFFEQTGYARVGSLHVKEI